MSWDVCGYVASSLVLAAFCMKNLVPLRLVALASNLAFIAYGLALGLTPIWILHGLLLLLNSCRLIEAGAHASRPCAFASGRKASSADQQTA